MSHHDLYILIGECLAGLGAVGFTGYALLKLRLRSRSLPPPPAAEPEPRARPEDLEAPGAPSLPPPSPASTPADTTATPAPPTERPAAPPPPRLNATLRGTRESFWGKIQRAVTGAGGMESTDLEIIEEILYTSDLGPTTVTRLLGSVEASLSRKERRDLETLKTSLKTEVSSILETVPRMGRSPFENFDDAAKPQVWMIVGVNGAGKTTSIGKIAHLAASRGARVLVAAGDTFRAAAQAQLKTWTERAQVEIFAPENVTDPGAVAFDAVQMAKARGYDLVLIDTAGRLHTQTNLMDELAKVKRVIAKLDPAAPHEVLIVLDANSGQNALVQAQKFNESLTLTGAIFTKMDGTAKGGVVLGLASQLELPTVFLGVGEAIDQLTGFSPREYAEALFEA